MKTSGQSSSFLVIKDGEVSGDVFSDSFDFSKFGSVT
jgi:hypothetical protein